MNTKELKKLSRKQLLEILLGQVERIENLEKENKFLSKELSNKKLNISESGNLAEAALKLSGIFESAQEAITIYQNNIEALNKSIEEKITKEFEKEKNKKLKEVEKICEKKKEEAKKILANAKKEVKEKKDKVEKSKKAIQEKNVEEINSNETVIKEDKVSKDKKSSKKKSTKKNK